MSLQKGDRWHILAITLCHEELQSSPTDPLERDGGSHIAGELGNLVWGLASFFRPGPDSNCFRLVDISDSVDATQFCCCGALQNQP